MPELSCLFARATPEMLAALSAEPICRERLHRFAACDGLVLHGQALAVVHLAGTVEQPWDVDENAERGAWSGADLTALDLEPPPLARHRWLDDHLPPPDVAARWAAVSRRTGQRLAWWWWWERGDDLYADAAWLLSPDGQVFVARTTELATDDDAGGFIHDLRGMRPTVHAPFELAMAHLGMMARVQYFPPAERWHFDWGPFRWPPAS